MQHAMHNRATMRVADTTEVSGRVTADEVNLDRFHNRIRKVCALGRTWLALVAASVGLYLVVADRGLAQNQNDQGIKSGVPNGTYVGTNGGYLVPPTPGISGQVPLAAATRGTYTPNATGSGGTVRGISTFSIGSPDFSQVFGITFAGTFTRNGDGSFSETITTSQGVVLHFTLYPSPDGNTIAAVQTDLGSINNGVLTRSSPTRDEHGDEQ